jgi:hypothetical protein
LQVLHAESADSVSVPADHSLKGERVSGLIPSHDLRSSIDQARSKAQSAEVPASPDPE